MCIHVYLKFSSEKGKKNTLSYVLLNCLLASEYSWPLVSAAWGIQSGADGHFTIINLLCRIVHAYY